GKSARDLGVRLQDRALNHEPAAILEDWFTRLVPLLGTKGACTLTGRSRSTHYRHLAPPPEVPTIAWINEPTPLVTVTA
ncbi:MAG: hypothetical protein ACRDVE_04265, partial [Actinocrinis sp.]